MTGLGDDPVFDLANPGLSEPDSCDGSSYTAAGASGMLRHLFAYGTLLIPSLFARVVGREFEAHPATLLGYARYSLAGRPYPGIVELPGGSVDGVVYTGLELPDLERLDAYEGALYERRELCVRLGERSVVAYAYALEAKHSGLVTPQPWDLGRFEREHLAHYLADTTLASRP